MAKCLLGVLFILSAVLKFISIDAFERYLFSFTLFSFNFCSFAARLVIAAESLIGFAFILNYRHKLLCRITAVVLAVFSCFLLYLVFVGNEENCHCFGEVIDMRPEESWSKNVGLAILLAVVWRYSGKKEILSRWLAHIVFVAVFIAPFIFSVPDCFVRSGRRSKDLVQSVYRPVADSLHLSTGKHMVCLYSVHCSFCKATAQKVAAIARRHHLSGNEVRCLFIQTEENMQPSVSAFFAGNGGQVFPYDIIDPFVFLDMTGGVMPIVLLTSDTDLVAEYNYRTLDERAITDFFNH